MSGGFWHDRLHELMQWQRDRGYALPGHPYGITKTTPLIDSVLARAEEEAMQELKDGIKAAARQRRQAVGKAHVDAVLTRHRSEKRAERDRQMRQLQLRARMAFHEFDMARLKAGR